MPVEGGVCWVEIPVRQNLAKLQEFYAAVFPNWKFTPSEESEGVVTFKSSEDGMGGGLVTMPKGCALGEQVLGTGFTVYFWVDSIEEATERIESAGGKTVLPKVEQGKMGYFSNLVDIEGNRFGIYQLRK